MYFLNLGVKWLNHQSHQPVAVGTVLKVYQSEIKIPAPISIGNYEYVACEMHVIRQMEKATTQVKLIT